MILERMWKTKLKTGVVKMVVVMSCYYTTRNHFTAKSARSAKKPFKSMRSSQAWRIKRFYLMSKSVVKYPHVVEIVAPFDFIPK